MKSNLEFISTRNMSKDDWLKYRDTGVGASEVGTILGLNPYKASIQLFYEKIGMTNKWNIENMAMFAGTELEAVVANWWQYWDGTMESMIENFRANNIVRKCQRVNAYVRNPKYPYLFVSLDRKINKTDRGEGALEVKTLSGYVADQWESGIPMSHIVQVQTQIMVCEFDFGELAVLKDGRNFDVYPFDTMPEVQNTIWERVKDFWDRVLEARKYVNEKFEAERTFNLQKAQEMEGKIAEFEPEPDGSDAYKDYLKEKYRNPTTSERIGTNLELNEAIKELKVIEQIKELKEQRQLHQNKLKKAMGDVQSLEFGANGRVTWRKAKDGSRRFLNKIKENEQ